MHPTVTNADEPGLGFWVMGKETIRGGDGIIGDFKRPCFNVNSHDLTGVVFFYLWPDLLFIEFGAPSGELF